MLCFGFRRAFVPTSSRMLSAAAALPITPAATASATCTVVAPSAVVATRSYVSDLSAVNMDNVKEYSVDEVWTMWNEGNLFSLSVQELSFFLVRQRVLLDPKWKKAALVRQVETFMQNREDERKGKPKAAPPAEVDPRGNVGAWDRKAANTRAPETLLDLNQAGFYENGSTTLAPRAFQLFVGQASQDLVVSRLNTTAFPGFAANAECFTLSAADAHQAALARYNKTLQWCYMNMRSLSLVGEIHVEFGKLLVMQSVLKKKSSILSGWTLQQRLQNANPMHWVSCASATSMPAVEKLMAKLHFVPQPKEATTYDATIKRANGNLNVKLNKNAAVTEVARPWEFLQRANVTNENGVDVRLLTRGRAALPPADIDTYSKTPIVDVKAEPVKPLLLPTLGEIVYLSENDTRSWSKPSCVGTPIVITETKRDPLMIAQDEENGFRLEYSISVPIADKTDLVALGTEVFNLAKTFGAELDEGFKNEFKTTTTPLDLQALTQKQ